MDRLTAETKPHRNGVIEGLRLRLWPRDVAGSMLVVWSGGRLGRGLRGAGRRASRGVRELPVRPREHDAGGLEHGARRPLQMTDRPRAADVPARFPRRSLLALSPLHGGCGRARSCSRRFKHSLGVGRLPVFWLARKHTGDDRAACTSRSRTSSSRGASSDALFDFHPVTLAVPLLLFMIWFLDEDRLSCGDSVRRPRRLVEGGHPARDRGDRVWYAVRRTGRWSAGRWWCWALEDRGLALDQCSPLRTGGPNPFYGRWESVGGSPSGIVKTLFTDPGQIWHEATTGKDLLYLFLLFVPFLFLWAFEPLLVVAALPILALNLLSTFPSMNSIRYQYVSAIVACVFAATAIGAGRLGPQRARVATLGVMGLIAALWLFGPLGFGGSWKYISDLRTPSARLEAAREAVKLIPPSAAVSASNSIGAHLSERQRIFLFPVRADADWVVVDKTDPWLALTGEADDPVRYNAELGQLRRDRRWRLVFDDDGVLVYKRVAARLSPS